MTPMVTIDNLHKTWKEGLTVFNGLDLSFGRGQITAILGPSGCGKTSLLRLIAGLSQPSSGTVAVDAKPGEIGMVFQEYTAFPWLTAAGNVRFALSAKCRGRMEIREAVDAWLEMVELLPFRDYYPAQLSGGMKQRLALARTLAAEPRLLLLDEPFGALDVVTRKRMTLPTVRLLRKIGLTVIMVTHSVREALLSSERMVVLSDSPCKVDLDYSIPPDMIGNPRFGSTVEGRDVRWKIGRALRPGTRMQAW
ncbi:MAG: ABC transporter ATP-binding protein [Alphaproteobacteria bacterium]|nr:ABC transporter ATP-binding protein [Alphaproteobacteria bacterium]